MKLVQLWLGCKRQFTIRRLSHPHKAMRYWDSNPTTLIFGLAINKIETNEIVTFLDSKYIVGTLLQGHTSLYKLWWCKSCFFGSKIKRFAMKKIVPCSTTMYIVTRFKCDLNFFWCCITCNVEHGCNHLIFVPSWLGNL